MHYPLPVIPSGSFIDGEYSDINLIGRSYETLWYFQYFKQLEFHYEHYDDMDWLFAYYQVDGEYLDVYHPDEGASFEDEVRLHRTVDIVEFVTTELDDNDDYEMLGIENTEFYHYHASSLNQFNSHEEMINTLLIYNAIAANAYFYSTRRKNERLNFVILLSNASLSMNKAKSLYKKRFRIENTYRHARVVKIRTSTVKIQLRWIMWAFAHFLELLWELMRYIAEMQDVKPYEIRQKQFIRMIKEWLVLSPQPF